VKAISALALVVGLIVTGTQGPTAAAPSCAISTAPLPAWTATASPPSGVPHALSPRRDVAAVLFGSPLTAPPRKDRNNKILWIVRTPRNGRPLKVTATPIRQSKPVVRVQVPADSTPGEIYPSIIDVPTPGCWRFQLEWAGHRSTMTLAYQSP
jgi:hypothetical protein